MSSARQVKFPCFCDVIPTTDATPTPSTVSNFAVPSGATGFVDCNISLKNTSTGDSAMIRMTQAFKNVAGSISLVGVLTSLVGGTAGLAIGDAGLTTAVALFEVVSGNLRPKVTGILATNIQWQLDTWYTVN